MATSTQRTWLLPFFIHPDRRMVGVSSARDRKTKEPQANAWDGAWGPRRALERKNEDALPVVSEHVA
jgi:hypothetical protein